MTALRRPRVEPLAPHHDRQGFACGTPQLDDYLRRPVGQDIRRNLARLFVASDEPPERVIGFYTLSALAIEGVDLPAEVARRLPRYPIPAALIGRLAVDRAFAMRDHGKFLLVDALRRVANAAGCVAIRAVVGDAKDDQASAFYRRFGFEPFRRAPGRLFLPTASLPRQAQTTARSPDRP